MDLKRSEMKQKICDTFTELKNVMENTQKELISSFDENQQNQIDASKAEISELRRKLHEEKLTVSRLNEKIAKLKEKKNRMELESEFVKEDFKRQLEEEINKRKQLESQLQLTAESRWEMPSEIMVSALSPSPYQSFHTDEDEPLTDTIRGRENIQGSEDEAPWAFNSNSTQLTQQKKSLNNCEQVREFSRERDCLAVQEQGSSHRVKLEVFDEAESPQPQSSLPFQRRPKPSLGKKSCSWKRKQSPSNKPCPASRKRKLPTASRSPSPSSDTSQKTINHYRNLFIQPHASTSNSLTTRNVMLNEDSILKVPEMYRINYGFSNNHKLDLCPHARSFWYDELHVSSTKYLLRFFDDDREKPRRGLTIKEQVGLAEPTVFQLSLTEIVQRLEDNIEKPGEIRIFLDVRDWNIFSHSVSQFFNNFGSSITHFSFGPNLYSTEEFGADHLLEFICKNLPNLEYLAINDSMLKRITDEFCLPQAVRDHSLEKLKILRLVNVRLNVGTPFIMAILLRAPNLSRVYGLPLHLLEEVEKQFWEETKGENSDKIKSVGIYRMLYVPKNKARDPLSYDSNLMTLFLCRPALEELDTRTSFIFSPESRQSCLEKLSEVLRFNAHSLKLLHVEPLDAQDVNSLKFPRLDRCETLQLDMTLRPMSKQRYFPQGMELPDFFPNLKSVKIALDYNSDDRQVAFDSLRGEKARNLFNAHFSQDNFSTVDALKTVRRLSIVNFTPGEFMGKFQNLCPYITILELNQTLPVLSYVIPCSFRLWPGLKQLVLEVTFYSDRETNLDSAFTGISERDCKSLENLKAEDHQGRMNIFRRNTAIWCLKELTLLKIVLFHKGNMASGFRDCLMTPISAIYGFGKELMPNLNVIIGFDDRVSSQERFEIIRHLEPMKDFLTIDD